MKSHPFEALESEIRQREAVGPWKHDDIDRQYPMPESLTLPQAARSEGGR